jgi:hypothetical protein
LKVFFDTSSKTKRDIVYKDQRHVGKNLLGIVFIELKDLPEALGNFLLVFGRDRLENNTPIFCGVNGSRFVHGHNIAFPFE